MTITKPDTKPNPPRKKSFWLWGVLLVGLLAIWWFIAPRQTDTPKPTVDTPKPNHQAVVYDFVGHKSAPHQPKDYATAKKLLGDSALQSDSLDYHGGMATRYDYALAHEPTLYVVESDGLFELVWYFAKPTDSDAQKQASIRYAQRAYQVASSLSADKGGQMVMSMLTDPKHKDAKIAGVLTAQCMDYTCRIVWSK